MNSAKPFRRNITAYAVVLALSGCAIWFTLALGEALLPPVRPAPTHAATDLTHGLQENLQGPLGVLLMQIIVIVLAARSIGALALKVGQPRVIGEMVAGIVLGPSLLGFIAPGLMSALFPAPSLEHLRMFSQVGVILFMFLVGTEIELWKFRTRAHTAVLVSHASIVVPFLLGTALSFFIYRKLAPPDVPFRAFALFMGVAMSITAFPVLARIIEERGLLKSELGLMALGCAAVDDVTAWCMLAVVLTLVKAGGLTGALLTMVLLVAFMAIMLFGVKPLLRRLAFGSTPVEEVREEPSRYHSWSAAILAFALLAALITEVIGVHALFGAFLAGVIIPPGAVRAFCRERFESITSGLLLPLFFAFTGLRTQIGLLNDAAAWLTFGAVMAVAVAGKLGGSMLAARWSGLPWRDSFALGALMNTRGLMELIVLNIAYDLGILSPAIFAMLVLMAIATTVMTAPLLTLSLRTAR